MRCLFLVALVLVTIQLLAQREKITLPLSRDEINKRYLENGAHRVSYFSPEYQLFLDSAIHLDPNNAYLYQQKAMPYFKQRKYEAGMVILDKAVALDAKEYIDYRAFIKCIFAKTYKEAIADFETSKKLKGEHNVVMDHSYDLYIGLCHLQLNDFKTALTFFERSIEHTKKISGETWVHHLDLFYAGVANYELKNYSAAISYFDMALKSYGNFSDVKYYKALSLIRLGQREPAGILLEECANDLKAGYTVNEDNAIYEKYPYQIDKYFVSNRKAK